MVISLTYSHISKFISVIAINLCYYQPTLTVERKENAWVSRLWSRRGQEVSFSVRNFRELLVREVPHHFGKRAKDEGALEIEGLFRYG